MKSMRQVLSSFKEQHYFFSGLALGFISGIVIEKVLGA